MTEINESKTLTKHLQCQYKCKFDSRKCNSNHEWDNDNWWCMYTKHHICKKDYIRIMLHVLAKMVNI